MKERFNFVQIILQIIPNSDAIGGILIAMEDTGVNRGIIKFPKVN